jgi:hypothetical protein
MTTTDVAIYAMRVATFATGSEFTPTGGGHRHGQGVLTTTKRLVEILRAAWT